MDELILKAFDAVLLLFNLGVLLYLKWTLAAHPTLLSFDRLLFHQNKVPWLPDFGKYATAVNIDTDQSPLLIILM